MPSSCGKETRTGAATGRIGTIWRANTGSKTGCPIVEMQAPCIYAMARVQAFKAFLKSREAGLIQKSAEWVKARQETIGASEISVLTGSLPFETKETLISKKICPADMSKNVACTWGFLFEPIVRRYFEQKNSVKVFGHTMSLNLAKDHPLYGEVTCSPDGYFSYKDESRTSCWSSSALTRGRLQ